MTIEPKITGRKATSKKDTTCRKCGTSLFAGVTFRQMYQGEEYIGDQCFGACARVKAGGLGICRYCGEQITLIRDQKWDHQPGSTRTHRALPLVVEEDRLLLMKDELNSLPEGKTYWVNEKLVFMVMARIDKEISKPYRLVFLTWAFDRPITTSKINRPEMDIADQINSPQMIMEEETDQPGDITQTVARVLPAITTGLEPHEAMAILKWAAPGKIQNDGPWTFGRTFQSDLRLIRIHIGNQMSFLPGEARREQTTEEA